MSVNLNDTTPAAPAGGLNVKWQTDGSGNDSAYIVLASVASALAPTVNDQTANYVAVIGDANNVVTMSVAGANTFTVPPHASVAWVVGTTLTIIQKGAGQVTLTPGAAVTLQTASSLTTRAQWSIVSLTNIATDVWVAGGDLT
jgi:hypothetical protein